jgi:alpha-L-fucosidase
MRLIILITLACLSLTSYTQESFKELPKQERLEWFKDAKLGIFIHWGIYSVKGVDESWAFFNGYVSHKNYMKQLDGFNAKNYKPEEWVSLIQESGAKYTVLTTKHHDGVALWDSKAKGNINTKNDAKAQKDLLKPFVDAVRATDLKLGFYYSLIDWSYPDYPNHTRKIKRYKEDQERLDKFTEYNFKQLDEISYYNPDLYWFDGDWELSAEQWKAKDIRQMLLKKTPTTIINSRLQGYGDYATPEQGVPIHQPKDEYWELCMTINDSWGFQHTDKKL